MFYSRGKNKIPSCYTLQDMYLNYIKEVEINSPYNIPYSTYVSITTQYIDKIIERLFEGTKIILPFRLGLLQIVKKKMFFKSQINKKKGIDWAATTKYGKVMYHLNEHSGGYKYLFYWDRRGNSVKNINSYRFVPARVLKRMLAKLIKEEKKDYFEAP